MSLATQWYDAFSRLAADLYPGRYTLERCRELAETAMEIRALASEKQSTIVAHNYLYPELQELADQVGDSLALAFFVRDRRARRVDFQSVYFMAATGKIIVGNATRVFVSDRPEALGCSLVSGIDHGWIEGWKARNPDGVLVTYVNSDAYTKSISDFVSTSRNTDRIIVEAVKRHPGRRILVLPDRFLGLVMKRRALEILEREGVATDADSIEIYTHRKGEWRACCHVHERIGRPEIEAARAEHPDAELLIHPECACAPWYFEEQRSGAIPPGRVHFLSTEGMLMRARASAGTQFIVATEKGMVYRLRKECPGKAFFPASAQAECEYMKANELAKLAASLREDRLEIVSCDDCCDPRRPYGDDRVVHLPRSIAGRATIAIERMLAVS